MTNRQVNRFIMKCANASDTDLIRITLDEMQGAEYNEYDAQTRISIASDELERRGLDVNSIQPMHEDIDVA